MNLAHQPQLAPSGKTATHTAQRALSIVPAPALQLQRKCACGGKAGADGECEECRKKRLGSLQRRADGARAGGNPS